MEHYASVALLSRPLGTSTKERKNKKLSTTTSSPKVRRKKEEKQRKKGTSQNSKERKNITASLVAQEQQNCKNLKQNREQQHL
jgi:hypothetical protein